MFLYESAFSKKMKVSLDDKVKKIIDDSPYKHLFLEAAEIRRKFYEETIRGIESYADTLVDCYDSDELGKTNMLSAFFNDYFGEKGILPVKNISRDKRGQYFNEVLEYLKNVS
jgi:hypothetical protein